MVLTLERWRAFATAGRNISFPKLELIGRDHEPPIVAGTGEIEMDGLNGFNFRLEGRPEDVGYALAACNRYRESPYEPLARLRLSGTDADGVDWSGGWATPSVHPSDGNWKFTGDLEGLVTEVRNETVSRQAGTELMFPLRIGDPMAVSMARFVRQLPPAAGKLIREYEMRILDSNVLFNQISALYWSLPNARVLSSNHTQRDGLQNPFESSLGN